MKNRNRTYLFIFLLIVYVTANVFVIRTANSQSTLMLMGSAVRYQSFTGVFSSIANICAIFLVVFLGRPGFIMALILYAVQLPMLLFGFFVQHRPSSISGCFSNLLSVIAIIIIYRRNRKIEEFSKNEVEDLKDKQKFSQRLFEQTATALVNAIDAKDTYSHGHSLRVAEYSEKIAQLAGKNEEECRQIYYAALLHDVGKIGISNDIINKKGKLTAEEYEVIKQHPVMGNQILSSIREYPYLSIGAHYHHERYDGKGYPDGLKGGDIPEIARIISVADAYDAMSSNRSYRSAIPQQLVREEIVKGAGNQFDPQFAKIMQHLIDGDTQYKMRERNEISELSGRNELNLEGYRSDISDGIIVTSNNTRIQLKVERDTGSDFGRGPAMILFDSLDARVHRSESAIRELNYFEFCEIWLDGKTTLVGARKIETEITDHDTDDTPDPDESGYSVYNIEAVKVKDHLLVTIDDGSRTSRITVALPDSSRFVYIGLTGEHCRIFDVSISKDKTPVADDCIKRIAEEISYIDGPEGDIPNVQIDGYRADSSEGIVLKDSLDIIFHSKSLPVARLIWHCAYLVIYSSADGKINGKDYKEYSLIRLDGENWEAEGVARNKLTVNVLDSFEGWEVWKQKHKEGIECRAHFTREGNVITMTTENLGISLIDRTQILEGVDKVYVAITGDQCAITNIRIN